MSISGQCILEMKELSSRAEKLARGTAKDRQESAVLLQRIANLREQKISSNEAHSKYAVARVAQLSEELSVTPNKDVFEKRYKEAFFKFISRPKSSCETELRDLLSGTQSILY